MMRTENRVVQVREKKTLLDLVLELTRRRENYQIIHVLLMKGLIIKILNLPLITDYLEATPNKSLI